MPEGHPGHDISADPTTRAHAGEPPKLLFADDTAFQVELRRRVDEYFQAHGRGPYADWRMALKTLLMLAFFAAAWALLVFAAQSLWQGLALAVVLGLATASIGLNVQHDGGHRAYSARPWLNHLAALTLDLIGGSSYIWRWKHALIHHRYVNITGYDTDIDFGILARISPHKPRRFYHRWQHLYIWPFYGFLAIKWQLVDDFRNVIFGRLGRHRLPRPTGWHLVTFIAGKALLFTWAFAIPLMFHSLGVVAFYYGVAAAVLGMVLSIIFLLPHSTGLSDFPVPNPRTGRMDAPWSVHQALVTANYARGNPIAAWLLGGLNYHAEHHLLPGVCHIHYPRISPIVEATCRDFNVPYKEHRTFLAGLAAHYRWLRQMGRPDDHSTQPSPDDRQLAC